MHFSKLISAFLLAFSVINAVAAETTAPLPLHIKADAQDYDLQTREFSAQGNATVSYMDVILKADTISGSAETGDVKADGGVSFQGPNDRKLTGKTFQYNFNSGKGFATDAYAESNGIHFHGAEMTADPKRYVLTDSRFSTCNEDHPHYYLSAGELKVEPDKRMVAKNVRLVLYDRTLLHIPRYSSRLSKSKGESGFQMPSVGIGDRSGIYAGYKFDLGPNPQTAGTLDIRLSTKWFLQGALAYESIGGGPVFARLAHRQPYRGGTRFHPMVSRLPEVGVHFGPRSAWITELDDSLGLSSLLIRPTDSVENEAAVTLSGEVGIGRFAEEPDFEETTRTDARVVCKLRPRNLGGGVMWSPGVFGRASHYQSGDDYTDVGARLSAAKQLGEKSFVSLSYLTHSVAGESPLAFDRVSMKTELASLIGFPIGSYGLEIETRYDLGDHKLFDAEVTLKKSLHCLEPSITWRKRSGSLSFNLTLVQL